MAPRRPTLWAALLLAVGVRAWAPAKTGGLRWRPGGLRSSSFRSSVVRFGADAESEADVSSFYAALRSRSEELQSAAAVIESRWRSGSCVSRVAVSCGDWIRRMAFDRGVVTQQTHQNAAMVASQVASRIRKG